MATYNELMTAIVQRFSVMLGSEDAIRYARRVPSLVVENDGRVASRGDREMLKRLCEEYQRVGGTISVYFMKSVIARLKPDPDVEIPEELR